MSKNWPKMSEIKLRVLHMINDHIFEIFCLSTFSFAYFLDQVLRVIFFKFCQNSGYQKEEVEKQKIIYHIWDP